MNAPQLQCVHDASRGVPATGPILDEDKIAKEVIERLRTYPHFVLLKGMPATEDRQPIQRIAHIVAQTEPLKESVSAERRDKVSFTGVRINPRTRLKGGGSTGYSRTNQPLELHTDSSYLSHPHELVAFQMVRADPEGGDTLMAPVEDIVSGLDAYTRSILERPAFPFGRGDLPILWSTNDLPCIRYYRGQIESVVEQGRAMGREEQAAIGRLDAVIAEVGQSNQFRIEAGETLFIRNTMALHGRIGFAPDSDRLMYRFRAHAGCLG